MSHQTVVLDVRAQLRSGGAPCSTIMESAGRLETGDVLQLIAPFEPTPLYEVLGREGFSHESRELDGGDWEVCFTKQPKGAAVRPSTAIEPGRGSAGCGCTFAAEADVVLDVRGLEPPQPMVRILETIETLPVEATLHALTDRQPVHLIDQLKARGFRSETSANPEGGYITFIRRR